MPVAAGATSAATALTEEPPKVQEEVKGRTKEEVLEVKDTAEEAKEDTKEEDTRATKEVGPKITRAAGSKEEVKEDMEELKDIREEVKEGTKEARDGTKQEEVPRLKVEVKGALSRTASVIATSAGAGGTLP